MGGGATMRSAAKVAGLGIISSGYSSGSSSSISLTERVVVSARNSSVPFSASVLLSPHSSSSFPDRSINNSTDSIFPSLIASSSLHRPSSELSDWEFVGEQEEEHLIVMDDHHRPPVLSLGDVPSIEEASEAVSDLRLALDALHFSASVDSSLTTNVQGSELPRPVSPKSEISDSARKAFVMLRDNPSVQNVVVSLASDKNIWDAVMKNKRVVEFIKKTEENTCLSNSEFETKESPENKDGDGKSSGGSEKGLMKLMQAIKLRMRAMVQIILDLLQCIFPNADGSNSGNLKFLNSTSVAATLISLTIATIMVVVVKRS